MHNADTAESAQFGVQTERGDRSPDTKSEPSNEDKYLQHSRINVTSAHLAEEDEISFKSEEIEGKTLLLRKRPSNTPFEHLISKEELTPKRRRKDRLSFTRKHVRNVLDNILDNQLVHETKENIVIKDQRPKITRRYKETIFTPDKRKVRTKSTVEDDQAKKLQKAPERHDVPAPYNVKKRGREKVSLTEQEFDNEPTTRLSNDRVVRNEDYANKTLSYIRGRNLTSNEIRYQLKSHTKRTLPTGRPPDLSKPEKMQYISTASTTKDAYDNLSNVPKIIRLENLKRRLQIDMNDDPTKSNIADRLRKRASAYDEETKGAVKLKISQTLTEIRLETIIQEKGKRTCKRYCSKNSNQLFLLI